ncbi:glutathione S-transferase [Terrarubrum flagellatum]|uniref:glutathione S-transferase family protein n=1 Tax=Terrirubrum flagellatum TaxID=2895980 RepID=UPI00314549E1
MAEYRLHCFGESGNAYKAALMLAVSGADWERVPVDYFNGQTRTPDFREEINAMGEVPVLEHRGRKLSQSGVILTYLAEQTGKFGPRDDDERYEILRWMLFDNHKFTSYYATLRFQFGIQKTGETAVTEFLRTRALSAYQIVEKQLGDREFLLGDRPTIADFSLAGYVYYPEETGIDLGQFPAIAGWKTRIAALPGWQAPYDLMPRAQS